MLIEICYEVKHQNTAPTPEHGENKMHGIAPMRGVLFLIQIHATHFSNATFPKFWLHCVYNGALCYLAHCRKLIEYVLYVITYKNKELRND